MYRWVSIPFKREGLSELYVVDWSDNRIYVFQFPSNGKDFPNTVYIPPQPLQQQFQFPSNGKDFPNGY